MDRLRMQRNRWRQWSIALVLMAATIPFANAEETGDVKRTGRGRVAPTTNPINLTVTTDRQTYPAGQMIQIAAHAVYSDGAAVETTKKAIVVISNGSGQRVLRGALDNQGSGTFTSDYATESSATPGSWEIDIEIEDLQRNKAEKTIFVNVTAGSPPPCEDADGDGYTDAACGGTDCNDSDPFIHPGAAETCGDGIDQDCSGGDLACEPPACADADGDGYDDAACGGTDCNDADPLINPGAEDICGDGIDQNCTGADRPCGDPHGDLQWTGPQTCLNCHEAEANEVHGSVMYQWKGETPQMVNGEAPQGKIAGAVNSYCINILGNWAVCGNCHLGLGELPEEEPTPEGLANIDCMVCHQQAYRRTKVDGVFVPDTDNMAITMDEAARTVHRPARSNCLQCHAKAGGGDAVKRGDLTLAHADTTDFAFDVHMASTGANLECQECHTFTAHRVAGRGSDLRPTDSDGVLECTNCHSDMAAGEHEGSYLDRHTSRVACQTCHIPVYAKDASDNEATEATEFHRTWLASHSSAAPFHPVMEKANDLIPEYRFWNRLNDNYLLGDVATVDSHTGRYPTSRPIGDVADPDAKLYAFKYKTAQQPITNSTSQLIALDTSVFFASGDFEAATVQGLVNMGLDPEEPYSWIETDTYQMLNHEVSPSGQALQCDDCHGGSARMDLQGDLGYQLKGPMSEVCVQCHGYKSSKGFTETHDKHVKDKRYDCSHCHEFSRPERGLRMP